GAEDDEGSLCGPAAELRGRTRRDPRQVHDPPHHEDGRQEDAAEDAHPVSAGGPAPRLAAVGTITPALVARWPTTKETWPTMPPRPRARRLRIAGGRGAGPAFSLRNPCEPPIPVRHFAPYLDFDLAAQAGDGDVPIVQSHDDVGAQPVAATIAPCEA